MPEGDEPTCRLCEVPTHPVNLRTFNGLCLECADLLWRAGVSESPWEEAKW